MSLLSRPRGGRDRRPSSRNKKTRNVPVAVPVESAYLCNMSVSLSRIVGLAVAVLLLGADATASARPKRHPAAQRPAAQVTTNCDGTPIIMQGMPCRPLPARAAEQATEQTGEQPPKGAERRRLTTRGSGGIYVPSVQRTPSLSMPQPSGSVYTPPAIANPSERIKDLNSSFPLNGGIGLNPSNRDEYIRYNLNR
jgi:hypothetical protein